VSCGRVVPASRVLELEPNGHFGNRRNRCAAARRRDEAPASYRRQGGGIQHRIATADRHRDVVRQAIGADAHPQHRAALFAAKASNLRINWGSVRRHPGHRPWRLERRSRCTARGAGRRFGRRWHPRDRRRGSRRGRDSNGGTCRDGCTPERRRRRTSRRHGQAQLDCCLGGGGLGWCRLGNRRWRHRYGGWRGRFGRGDSGLWLRRRGSHRRSGRGGRRWSRRRRGRRGRSWCGGRGWGRRGRFEHHRDRGLFGRSGRQHLGS
jgi:hypothetical protein